MIDFTATRLELEEALLLISKVEGLHGKRGYQKALHDLKRQAMVCRKNLKDMRVAILEEVNPKPDPSANP